MIVVAMVVLPRVGRRLGRTPRVRRLVGRLRRRSMIDRVLAWVEEERPDLAGATAPDGTVTVVFTDIEDSTALNERLGDRRWLEVLRHQNSIVRRARRLRAQVAGRRLHDRLPQRPPRPPVCRRHAA
jgi:class 3 adenylate cyclase